MDWSKVKKLVIPEGIVTKLVVAGKVLWQAITYKNWVPHSTDTDGSIFNGVGYIENRRLGSNGSLSSSTQNGSVTTGFIPWYGDTTIIRMKGVEWINATPNYGGHYYVIFYDANKKSRGGDNDWMSSQRVSAGEFSHILTATRDSNGVETFVFDKDYGTTNSFLQWARSASYIRITAYGKGADMIVTINEEIT